MPTPTFKCISVEQFQQILAKFPFTRRINAVHMHHTWRPRRADFRGHETIISMWRFHTETNGWRDIAQHITIDPEGNIWLGRDWNLPPASAAGHNGNAAFGPFMFEMVGNFDKNCDPFDGAQKDTALQVVVLVQQRFELATDTLRFHNMMSAKSCPGTAIDYAAVLAEVEASKQRGLARAPTPAARARSVAKTPFPDEAALAVAEAIRSLTRSVPERVEPGDAELTHDEHDEHIGGAPAAVEARGDGAAAQRSSGLSTAQIAQMRPHLINLAAGRFSSTGEVSTAPADVDAIFEQHLPKALQEANGQPLRLLFYAHGGLVSESNGLQIAHKHIGWWLRNGVYPIYFAWETGLFETIAQLLSRARRARGFDILEFTTDPLIELLARTARGPSIWGGMKASAEHAADAPTAADPIGGAAHYAATRLQAFCAANAGQVELHAVGHSAGAVFHSHFLPLAHLLGVPTFKSAHFMAPAVRVDTFKQRLLAEIAAAGSVESLTMYTMKKEFERKDNCAQIYRKSLLYLIHHALEDKNETPLLGLEKSTRNDAQLKALFGLAGAPSARGTVVWSPTQSDTGASASRALAHGDFDDDPPTMNSIVRRVLGKADADTIVDYPASRALSSAMRSWFDEIDLPEPFKHFVAAPPPMQAPGAGAGSAAALPAPIPLPLAAMPTAPGLASPAVAAPPTGGRRVAVCVGIDAYPDPAHQLGGCVNDARHWSDALRGLGFDTTLLLDGQATRAVIDQSLRSLVETSRAGDVIVFQYAGHGSTMPDLDGDEADGKDEALCPVDFAAGAFYIDDDIGQVLARIPDGVNLTCFMDCCHSGTNSRFAVGLSSAGVPTGAKARFVKPTSELIEAHKRFRSQGGRSVQPAAGTGGRNRMHDIKFAACLDHQVALESAGSGEFTLRALRVLGAGIDGLSNEQFLQRVVAAFGPDAAQNPMLDCADGAGPGGLLQPLYGGAPARTALVAGAARSAADPRALETVTLLARAIDALLSR